MDYFFKLIFLFIVSGSAFAVPSLPTFGITRAGAVTTYTVGPSTFQPASIASTGTGLQPLNSAYAAAGRAYATTSSIPIGDTIAAVRVTSGISPAAMARAVVAFSKSPVGIAAILAGTALYKYLHDNQLEIQPSGVVAKVTPIDTGTSTSTSYNASPHYSYSATYFGYAAFSTISSADACAKLIAQVGSTVPCNLGQSGPSYTCDTGGTSNGSGLCVNAAPCVSPNVRNSLGACVANTPTITPLSDSEAEAKLTAAPPIDSDSSSILDQMNKSSPSSLPTADISPVVNLDSSSSFGPSDGDFSPGHSSTPQTSTPTAPESTTTPTGVVQSTTSTTTLANPTPQTITATTTTTTTTTNIDNSVKTTVVNNAPPAPKNTPIDPKTDCEKYPTNAGCLPLGTIPAADVIVTQTPSFSLNPTSLGSGMCPSDNVVNYSKGSLHFSYVPLCNLASSISPLMIALAWLAAGMLVLSPVRG